MLVSSKQRNMPVILVKADAVSLQTACGHDQLAFPWKKIADALQKYTTAEGQQKTKA